jgi:hypothetical protein|tara:strand:- start:2627 stop:2818 length:192 start_codon:yes stop_codon:yes gene_type:complete
MINLTHDESSAVDIGGVWVGPDEFELFFRLNADDEPDLEIHLILTTDELETLIVYLAGRLNAK